jgi:hypothetical protein
MACEMCSGGDGPHILGCGGPSDVELFRLLKLLIVLLTIAILLTLAKN